MAQSQNASEKRRISSFYAGSGAPFSYSRSASCASSVGVFRQVRACPGTGIIPVLASKGYAYRLCAT